jgi:hypothetical protein
MYPRWTSVRVSFTRQFVSHIDSLPLDQQSFNVRLQYVNKGSARGNARHDRVKCLRQPAPFSLAKNYYR